MCGKWIPGASEYLRINGKLVVKVNKAMYGLIQSAKLLVQGILRTLQYASPMNAFL